MAVTDENRARSETSGQEPAEPRPVTASADTIRPQGMAFSVPAGADLTGVPADDQTARNPEVAPGPEKGEGVGVAVPGQPGGTESADRDA
jgi:hypothetical protein